MCLAIPGKIVEIFERDGLKMAKVDYGNIFRETCLEYVPEAQVGEYCVVHVGFAISVMNEEDAQESLALLKEISDIEEELGKEDAP
ncbi:MAG: HypC/HybG/HupF family hydrogenase formation chaperone [Anaerolineales bacterium]|nr:HypC/HybG/HupF family hydrogenase formation chaperone [Anaerolineales bacterium]